MSEQPEQSPALVLGPGTDVVVDPASLEADAADPTPAADAAPAADAGTSTPDDLGGTAGGNAGGAG